MEEKHKIYIRGSKVYGNLITRFFNNLDVLSGNYEYGCNDPDLYYFVNPTYLSIDSCTRDAREFFIIKEFYKEISISEILTASGIQKWRDTDEGKDILDKIQNTLQGLCNNKTIAFAKLQAIIQNDTRFHIVLNSDWLNTRVKWCITSYKNNIKIRTHAHMVHLLAFLTEEEASIFIEENIDLIKDYYNIYDV